MAKVTIPKIKEMKETGEKITMITAYDYPMALLVDQAGIDMILIGDSLGMTMLGYDTTVPVTMEDMIHHTKAVVNGAKNTFIVTDMPFMSYNISIEEAIRNAGRLMKEGGADAVKLEGGVEMAETIKRIVDAGIPVVGHIGLTPQTTSKLGGFKVQGKTAEAAKRLLADAKALEEAGAFIIVLEAIPRDVAKYITENISVPTIGIGAGPDCDGQVLVMHDMLGLFDKFVPKFVKQYLNLTPEIVKAFEAYKEDVKSGAFPEEKHCFTIKEEELKRLY